MSKRGYIHRYLLILKKLKAKPYSSYDELQQHLDRQVDQLQMRDESLNVGFSKRTLQRDIKEIGNIFGLGIEYSKSRKGYFISDGDMEQMNFQRMTEAFDMFNSLNLAREATPFIHLEKRGPQGTEHLYGLLHAIKHKFRVRFSYRKFWEEEITQRDAAPYTLKEFKNRWYLLADNAGKVKTFALDRITGLEITNKVFSLPASYNAAESFRYCFGIISPDGQQPDEIVLSFNSFQGKYIKSLPLHETQEVIIDNEDEDELRIRLRLCITHDFIMELLSFGAEVRVLKPKKLIKEIKDAHYRAFMQYAEKVKPA